MSVNLQQTKLYADMTTFRFLAALCCALVLAGCDGQKTNLEHPGGQGLFSLSDVAQMLSELPLEREHLDEVYDAVNASSGHGYDEEYLLNDLFTAPGAGVGDDGKPTKAGGYRTPLRELFSDYFARKYGTKAGAADVERYINALSASDMQIYWPYSENWDGQEFPIVTFDPGYGAESNYGYAIRIDASGAHVVDSVLVNEQVAQERPVTTAKSTFSASRASRPCATTTAGSAARRNSSSRRVPWTASRPPRKRISGTTRPA